jgi:uncharacterized protein YbaP (TraB family)
MRILIILLLLPLITFGQEARPYPMDTKALLWEIKGNGAKKSYLYGTMHLIEKEYFYFPEKLEKFVKKSDVLVMELAGLPDQSAAIKFIMLEEGKSFFDFFNEEQEDSVFVWAKDQFDMEESVFRVAFDRMKPFAIVQMATQMHLMGKTESYEIEFEKLAIENELEIKGLETVEQQMKIFDDLTDEQQTEMVMSSIRDPKGDLEMTRNMMKLYSRQNLDSLYMMIEDEGGVLAEESQAFLDERNQNWIPQIQAIIKEKPAFIAVGAGHLGGPEGVIRLLEKQGYTLKPIEL